MNKKFSIKPNIQLTDDHINAERQFGHEMFGRIAALKQEVIEKLKKPIKSKTKIKLRVTIK